ncbi:Pentatricopeptide repeat-containing protein, mitochondrial [Sphaceloma murrayae]|uniref:Pentatricopeptide repeat-containing protein, mitochondrial n=1 Tax=Sphaceloma murrayae TaxID=2082308 RepID=A0A2K1QP87_9PEZI|nr:Pentatricopeptide repeat-containing protein, mitochondrial [Sphaceloma murrayae]
MSAKLVRKLCMTRSRAGLAKGQQSPKILMSALRDLKKFAFEDHHFQQDPPAPPPLSLHRNLLCFVAWARCESKLGRITNAQLFHASPSNISVVSLALFFPHSITQLLVACWRGHLRASSQASGALEMLRKEFQVAADYFTRHFGTMEPLISTPSLTLDNAISARGDAPLLDFLYPAQALVLPNPPIHGSSEGQRRRRVVGTRHYSSLPRSHHARDIRIAQIRPYSNQSPLDALARATEEEEEDSLTRGVNEEVEQHEFELEGRTTQAEEHAEELAEAETTGTATSALRGLAAMSKPGIVRALKEILDKHSSPRTPLPRVRALWAALDDSHRADPELLLSLHTWLATRRETATRLKAWTWSRDILKKIKPQARTLRTYRNGIEVHLRFKDERSAAALVRQAMNQRKSGDFGAPLLMSRHLKRRYFAQVCRLYRQIKDYSVTVENDEMARSLFEGIEDLMGEESWVTALINFMDNKLKFHDTQVQEDAQFIFGYVVASWTQLLSRSLTQATFRRRAAYLDVFLKRLKGKPYAAQAYVPLISAILKAKTAKRRKDWSSLLASVWRRYSGEVDVVPLKGLHLDILDAWMTGHLINPIPPDQGHMGLRPQDIKQSLQHFHGPLHYGSIVKLAVLAARSGHVEEMESLARDYVARYEGELEPDFFWTYVYVRARQRDSAAAQAAFDRIQNEFGVVPNARTWDILLWAYERSEDLSGLLACFRRRVASGVRLNGCSVSPLLNLYAKGGDTQAISELLNFARELKIPIDTHMMNSLIVAHGTLGEVDEAVHALEDTVKQHEAKEIKGPLGICFNSLLSLYANRNEFAATMAVYKQMQKQKIPFDERTYAAMVVALCKRRRPDSAWSIIDKVMPTEGFQPTSYHYTAVMAGFIRTRELQTALDIYKRMHRSGIQPTVGTEAMYLKAKALFGHYVMKPENRTPLKQEEDEPLDDPRPLEDTVQELLDALEGDVNFASGSEYGLRNIAPGQAKATLFETLIFVHGRRRCFDAAWQLFQRSTETVQLQEGEPLPIRLLTAMMSVYYNSGEYDDVERCWDLLVQQADRYRLVRPPEIADEGPRIVELLKDVRRALDMQSKSMANAERIEDPEAIVGPVKKATPSDSQGTVSEIPADRAAASGPPLQISTSTKAITLSEPFRPPATSSIISGGSQTFLLAAPFRILTLSFRDRPDQSATRITSLISTLSFLFSQRYNLDNGTWNILIQTLCSLSPPRTFLAYTLVEHFLIPEFPGWAYPAKIVANELGFPNTSRRAEGMQYMNFDQRFVPLGHRMPTYKTMVYLAHAALQLRRLETLGGIEQKPDEREEMLQVGSVKAVQVQAPKTVEAVKNMPIVYDGLQRRLIRGEDESGEWFARK